jgi:hypothetical protein
MLSYSLEDQQTHDYKKEIPSSLLDSIKSKRIEHDEIESQAESSYVTKSNPLLDSINSTVNNPLEGLTDIKGKGKEINFENQAESSYFVHDQVKPKSLLDEIKSRVNNTLEGLTDVKAREENTEVLSQLIQDEPNLDDSDLLKSTTELFKEDEPLIENKDYQESVFEANKDNKVTEKDFIPSKENQTEKTEVLPQIDIDSSSDSDKTLDHYFPKASSSQEPDVKSVINTMFEKIDSKINKSPYISQLGLHNSPSLREKLSSDNLFEDNKNLFDNEDTTNV